MNGQGQGRHVEVINEGQVACVCGGGGERQRGCHMGGRWQNSRNRSSSSSREGGRGAHNKGFDHKPALAQASLWS